MLDIASLFEVLHRSDLDYLRFHGTFLNRSYILVWRHIVNASMDAITIVVVDKATDDLIRLLITLEIVTLVTL